MRRRAFLQAGFAFGVASQSAADMTQDKLEAAAHRLQQHADAGTVRAASLHVRHNDQVFVRTFGAATSEDSIFLLASITKPMSIAAVMSLYDRGEFDLDDRVRKFIPEFSGEGRDTITIRQLMTHVSGLPDQLPQNTALRSRHAQLDEFVEGAIRTPLLFTPGSQYRYSSMAILLACEVAQRISQQPIAKLVEESVYRPLSMKHSALGLGELEFDSLMKCQVKSAAPESGAGDPSTKDWDWNSRYWRALGAPWGGAHGSAADVARFLDAFLHPPSGWLKPETTRLMIENQNPPGIRPRGLGFDLGNGLAAGKLGDSAFGHGGSTGTLCWADPTSNSLFVVLTTLPSTAMSPHPRQITSQLVAEAITS